MIISASEIYGFLRCRRSWDWESANRRNLTPISTADPLWLGTGVHHALEQFYSKKNPDPVNAFSVWVEKSLDERRANGELINLTTTQTMVKLGTEMLIGYLVEYGMTPETDVEGLAFLTTEQPFKLRIPGTEDGWFAGTIDGIVSNSQGLWVIDHKTAKTLPETPDIDMDLQFTGYVWAAQMLSNAGEETFQKAGIAPGTHINGIVYNGLRKQLPGPKVTKPLFKREYLYKWNTELVVFQESLVTYHEEMSNPNVRIYPTITRECSWCDFRHPCHLLQRGHDVEDVLRSDYTHKEQRGEVYPAGPMEFPGEF